MSRLKPLIIGSCLLLTLPLAGCSVKTPVTNYYSLVASTPQIKTRTAQPLSVAVAVGPIRIPQQLNRPQIVTRSDTFQVNIAEYERWSGDLQEEMTHVISSQLSHHLGTDKIIVTPWPKAYTPNWLIMVDVQRFDGQLDKAAFLEARWVLTKKETDLTLSGFSRYQEEVEGAGYAALVAAQSRLLETLSLEIAEKIRTHNEEELPRE